MSLIKLRILPDIFVIFQGHVLYFDNLILRDGKPEQNTKNLCIQWHVKFSSFFISLHLIHQLISEFINQRSFNNVKVILFLQIFAAIFIFDDLQQFVPYLENYLLCQLC